MLFRPRIGMHPQKMMEHVEENKDLVSVPVCLGRPDIIHNHVAHFLQAMFLMHKIGGERGRRDLGEVLVFGNCEHLFFTQAA